MEKKYFIFVYGLLRKDELYHSFIKEMEFIGYYKTKRQFYFLTNTEQSDAYVFDDTRTSLPCEKYNIVGEVYKMKEKQVLSLLELDAFVGHPYRYERIEEICIDKEGNELKCFCYKLRDPLILQDIQDFFGIQYELVEGGDWFKSPPKAE